MGLMHICYDEGTGRILYTVEGEEQPDTGDGAWLTIVLDGGEVFNPGAWHIVKEQILPLPPDIEAKRALMKCSRLQGRLVLGPVVCAQIDAIAIDPATPWAMKETIINAIEWSRLSETMDTLGWLMGFTPEQMDALFEAAMQVSV
jgi:hypothetical protein